MAYVPTELPSDLESLVELLRLEFAEISRNIAVCEPSHIQLVELNAEPARPREGMVVLADGTNWNPGSGAGYYGYRGGSWALLG